MKKKRRFFNLLLCLLVLIGLVLVACGGADYAVETIEVQVTRVVTEEIVLEGETIEVTVITEVEVASEESVERTASGSDAARPANEPVQQRLIIKDGNMAVTVDDTETAVTEATDVAVRLGGYIINQNVFDNEQGYRFATMRLGIPVDSFETALKALRELGTVTNESASGVDVTDEFVDLNSRVDNLIATRDRLRSFLQEAINVEEALRVNEELLKVEEEIAIIQGRINFLADRSAISTIDLTLNPWIPTPTPSPTPTATPIPTAESWRPGDTAKVASVQLQQSAQNTADFVIFHGISTLPWLLVWVVVGFVGWRIYRFTVRRESTAQQTVMPTPSTVEEDE